MSTGERTDATRAGGPPDPQDRPDPPDRLERLVARTEGLQPWRRVFHAASGSVLALGPGVLGLERGAVLGGLGLLLAAALVLDVARLRAPELNVLFFRLLSPLASPREARRLASSTWYLLGVLLVYAVVPGVAVPAVLVLALADPAAAVVGRRWGRHPLGKGSLEGGGAFLVVAAGVLLVTVEGPAAVVTALLATAAELLPVPVDDNLMVPLVAAAALALLGA